MIRRINIKEYKEMALKTIKPHTSKELALADWALGLGGELSEVVELASIKKVPGAVELTGMNTSPKMEFAKEVGDVLWYTVALTSELGAQLEDDIMETAYSQLEERRQCAGCMLRQSISETIAVLTIEIGSIQEALKHRIMHKEKTALQDVVVRLNNVIVLLAEVLSYKNIDIYDCALLNVEKLAHRYHTAEGGKYSHELSAQRHEREEKFEDTEVYKKLYTSITGDATLA